jgi:hypothetical protein
MGQTELVPGESEHLGRYAPLNAVWRAPKDGGTVYVGSLLAAKDRGLLQRYGITHVVNCMNQPRNNIHTDITYSDFSIEMWRDQVITTSSAAMKRHHRLPLSTKNAALVHEFFRPVLGFIDTAVATGGNVLVHCFAGAHRAGTTGVALLMHREGMGADDAIATAQQLRPAIDPKLHAENYRLLQQLELAANARASSTAATVPGPEGMAETAATDNAATTTNCLLNSAGPDQPSEYLSSGNRISEFDGSLPHRIELDDRSVVIYLPTFCQSLAADELDKQADVQADKQADKWYAELESVLDSARATLPPPNSSGGINATGAREQYYGVADDDSLRGNPRWLKMAYPLSGSNLSCVMDVKRAAEAVLESGDGLLTEKEQASAVRSDNGELFNSVLVNRYGTGSVGIKWHDDSEKCYGPSQNITIGSVSLGSERIFELRRKPRRGDKEGKRVRIRLQHGSLLVMAGATQEGWQHSVPLERGAPSWRRGGATSEADAIRATLAKEGGEGGECQECQERDEVAESQQEQKQKKGNCARSRINLTFRFVMDNLSRSKWLASAEPSATRQREGRRRRGRGPEEAAAKPAAPAAAQIGGTS